MVDGAPACGCVRATPERYLPHMPRRRPWSPTLAALFLLQLVFVGSGYVCAMPHAGDTGGQMAGMAMHTDHHAPPDKQAPCRFPWAPDGCQSMAPCAPAALTSPTQVLSPAPQPVTIVPALTVLTPPSQTSPPELPPPRA